VDTAEGLAALDAGESLPGDTAFWRSRPARTLSPSILEVGIGGGMESFAIVIDALQSLTALVASIVAVILVRRWMDVLCGEVE
jgi:hypothetical protein